MSDIFLLIHFLILKASNFKTTKDDSYFTSKSLFDFEIFKFYNFRN